ncbi:MAG TPA: ATP-binding protein [Thermoleophilaceae bacterium]|nr:ATP-binding protein [Thermoleophilaceae bacterium]
MSINGHPGAGPSPGPDENISLRLPASLTSARLGRLACRPLLPRMGERGGDLELLVTELITNGVRHAEVEGENSIWLGVSVGATHARVEVVDRGMGFERPALPEPGSNTTGGWGLVVVDELCDDWGIFQNGGTHVWGELPFICVPT